MTGGAHGQILHIDLSSQKIHVEQLPDEVFRLLVGGRALVAYFLLRDLPPNTDPFHPDNRLIFAPGILQGTNFPGSGRHGVGGKSPLTGAIGSSEVGGWWGHEFKRAGYDGLIIHGRAETPVYIWIKNENVEIRPADHLWGLNTHPTQDQLRSELNEPRTRIAKIGPAGENMVRYAAIMHDVNRAAGRNGLGALMGSKNLKAVAVRGTQKVAVADPKRVATVAKWLGKNYRTLAAWATAGIGRGTQDSLVFLNRVGGLPTSNFREPYFADAHLLSGERNYEMFLKDRDTCQACPISCKQVFETENKDPRRKLNPEYGGPEYEAMASLGPLCQVSDNQAVAKANELANAYGLDVISTGASIAFVMECFENGVLSADDTGGEIFHWGDGELLVRSVKKIALREGFGHILAEGVARMSQKFGPQTAAYNLTVKGQELPMHEPRLKNALGLGYAVAPVGADHMMNIHDTSYTRNSRALKRLNSILEKKIKPLSAQVLNEDKLQIFFYEVSWMHFQDCAVICHFYPYDYVHLAEALSGVTGIEYSVHEILKVGQRAQTLSRLFNLREGFTADDDRLPRRVRKAFRTGPLAGVEITDNDFEWAKRRYYELMNWDPQTGQPNQACLSDLSLNTLLNEIDL